VDNDDTNESADKAFYRFMRALTEIESQGEVEDEDILRLTCLLSDYAKHPDSTEEGRLNASKELDRVNAIYLSKNKT
jgi:hypothetical protein